MGHSSKTADHEDPATILGDSEELSIEHPVMSHEPELGKLLEDPLKVAATVAMEQCRDIFEHDPPRLYFADDTYGFKKKSAGFPAESGATDCASAAHVADIGARTAEGDAIDGFKVPSADAADIRELPGAGKSVSKCSPV